MLNLKKLLTKILTTPMVIEQGTSGFWTYRKWSNGTAECWGYVTESNLAMTSADEYAYYAPLKTYNYPSGLFASTPVVGTVAECGGYMVTTTLRDNTATAVKVYYSCSRSVTITTYGYIHAIGRWK